MQCLIKNNVLNLNNSTGMAIGYCLDSDPLLRVLILMLILIEGHSVYEDIKEIDALDAEETDEELVWKEPLAISCRK